jgi:hypothetical protein
MFTFEPGPAIRMPRGKTRADAPSVSAETSRAIAYGASQRVGWPRLTRGRGRKTAAFVDVVRAVAEFSRHCPRIELRIVNQTTAEV